jgi:arylsulfatase
MNTSFIKKVFLFFVPVIFFGFIDHKKEDQPGQPNIILIIVDDLGYSDLASYGNTDIHTPNIDALGNEGHDLQSIRNIAGLLTFTNGDHDRSLSESFWQ